jgi:hypothetical protein
MLRLVYRQMNENVIIWATFRCRHLNKSRYDYSTTSPATRDGPARGPVDEATPDGEDSLEET